ncbi:MAG: ComF family protein [Candidatus Omnitrophota bacterium]
MKRNDILSTTAAVWVNPVRDTKCPGQFFNSKLLLHISNGVKSFINLFYPLSCYICHAKLSPLKDMPLCDHCWQEIRLNPPPSCRKCGIHLPAFSQKEAHFCKKCQTSSYYFKKASSACIYEGIVKKCVHLFKYKRKLALAKPLSRLLVDFTYNFIDIKKIDLIVPVPLHPKKFRQRQFNQARILAQAVSSAFAGRLEDKALVKIKDHPAQANLSQAKRINNVQNSFRVKNLPAVKDKNILLIDDVLTTAATVNECAKVLWEAGAKTIEVLTLARTERYFPARSGNGPYKKTG